MMEDTFVLGVPGSDPKEAFRLAITLSENKPKEYGKMTDKYSFMLWDSELYDCYDDAIKIAIAVLEHAEEKPDIKVMPSVCIKYKNANQVVEFLFFGWNFE